MTNTIILLNTKINWIIIKIEVFSFAALFVLYPYLTIHMRELGISVEETAVMNAVTPVIAIIMPPLAGMAADRVGNFRVSIFSLLIRCELSLLSLKVFQRSFLFINLTRLSAVRVYQHCNNITNCFGNVEQSKKQTPWFYEDRMALHWVSCFCSLACALRGAKSSERLIKI